MNEKLRLIFQRRSIRRFRDRPVPDEMLRDLLEAAMAAPSAVAKDPWRFIVVRNRERLDEMAGMLPNAPMLRQAPLALVVCGDIDRAHDRQLSYLLQDCSAAIENILLAATALGLGACWLGVHPREDRIEGLKRLFRLPENVIPVSGIAIGFPAEEPSARTRFNEDYVHDETW